MNIPDGDYRDGRVQRRKTVVETFHLPFSTAVKFTPASEVRPNGGKRKKRYTAGELRRKAERKARRIQEGKR